jgi:hypothetical protein
MRLVYLLVAAVLILQGSFPITSFRELEPLARMEVSAPQQTDIPDHKALSACLRCVGHSIHAHDIGLQVDAISVEFAGQPPIWQIVDHGRRGWRSLSPERPPKVLPAFSEAASST